VSASSAARLLRLWTEAYEYGDQAGARQHVVNGLRVLFDAHSVVLTLLGDFRQSEQVRMFEIFEAGVWSPSERDAVLGAYAVGEREPAMREMRHHANVDSATKRRRDLVPDRTWYSSKFVRAVRLNNGFDDALYGNRKAGASHWVGLGVNRETGGRRFTEADRALLHLVTTESAWLFRERTHDTRALLRELTRAQRETLDVLLCNYSDRKLTERLGQRARAYRTNVEWLLARFELKSVAELRVLLGPLRQQESLSPRERELLVLLAKGLSYPAMAASLGLGLGTVQGYIKRMYAKLEINSKAEAAALAAKWGLV
jgi:DNA-binding CsgD family transcriptional regulator